MNDEHEDFDNFEEKPSLKDLKNALLLLMDKSTIVKIRKACEVRFPDAFLKIACHRRSFEAMRIFFLIEGENLDRREVGKFSDLLETAEFLKYKNGISAYALDHFSQRDREERFRSVVAFSEQDDEYKTVVAFLKENYNEHLENEKSPLTQSREQHGVFTKSPVLGSPRGTGKETKQPSPEATSPRTEETQLPQIRKLGSPSAVKK